jgi:pilus assembly protein CpaE
MTSHMNFSGDIRVLIVSGDSNIAGNLNDILSSLSHVGSDVLLFGDMAKKVTDERVNEYDLIVMDVGDGQILQGTEIYEFRRAHANNALVVVSDELSDDDMRLLFRLNGNDWLKKPFDHRSFINMISAHAQISHTMENRVHAVVSVVGGAGATIIAESLAGQLVQPTKRRKPRVSLFDMDFSTGSLGYYLNLLNDYDLTPVLANPSRVDLEFIDIVQRRHDSGFSLLSFKQPAVLNAPKSTELVLRMLDVLVFESDHTVLDIPYYDTPWKYDVLAGANTVFLITDLTIPALRQAKDIHTRIAAGRKTPNNIHIVVNKHRSQLFGRGIGKKQANKIFQSTKAIFLPDDWETINEAVNRGILPVEVNKRSKFCKALNKLGELAA